MEKERATTIHLVRHGHIVNRERVYHGRLPGFPLSERGREQAAAAARFLSSKPVVALYSSPMLRTRQTAEIIQQAIEGAPAIQLEPLLNEIYSPFDGKAHVEMEARNWDFYTDVSAPYEQPEDIVERVVSFFRKVRRHHSGEHVVGVTHADPLAFVWLWAQSEAITPEGRRRLDTFGLVDDYPATASISTFVFLPQAEGERPTANYVRPY